MPDNSPEVEALRQRIKHLEDAYVSVKGEVQNLSDKVGKILIEQAVQETLYSNILQEIQALRTDISEIKEKPARRWDVAVTALITGVISIALALLFKQG